MFNKILIGFLLGSLVLTQIWANKPSSKEKKEQFIINEESFNLIKSALIKVIKENKELKERLNQLETKVDRNSQNILVLASYSKDKIKEIKLQNNEEFERFKAQQKEVLEKTKKQKIIPNKKTQKQEAISINHDEMIKNVIEHFKNDTKTPLEAYFVRKSHAREGAGTENKSVKIHQAGDETKILGIENNAGDYWFQIADSNFTHSKNLKPIFKENKKSKVKTDPIVKEQASKLVKEIKQEQTKSKIELDMEKAQKILDEKINGGNQ